MADFCLIPEQADALIAAARAGKIDLAKMYEMDSKSRRDVFDGILNNKSLAKDINTEFEKAMASNDARALEKWANSVFNAKAKKSPSYRDVSRRIVEMEEAGILSGDATKPFLEDLVASRLGASVSAEEVASIIEKAAKVEELRGNGLSTATAEDRKRMREYFEAKKDLLNYLDSRTPSSNLRVATSTIGRGTMLFSVKSPFLNITTNVLQGTIRAVSRRIEHRRLGRAPKGLTKEIMSFNMSLYNATGFDITRMDTLSDPRKVLGEEYTTSQGEGRIRQISRFYEDIVFKQLQGAPDVAFATAAFVDKAAALADRVARGEGLKGKAKEDRIRELVWESINPDNTITSQEALDIRLNSIAEAQYATFTNKSKSSELALKIRGVLNYASGDVRLGDQLMPFIKTPANAIQFGVESSGVFIPVDVSLRMGKSLLDVKKGASVKTAFGDNFEGFSSHMIKAGVGTTFAFLLAMILDIDDFMGEYPTSEKERRLMEQKKATPNSLKIGGVWVSTDYFGSLAPALTGFLYARKYGVNLEEYAFNYYRGSLATVAKIPGMAESRDVTDTITQFATGEKTQQDIGDELTKFSVNFVSSRTIPAFVSDIARATDPYERDTERDALKGVQSRIPIWREQLKEKRTVFGETIDAEMPISRILFGSRVRAADESRLTKELNVLAEHGQLPSLTNMSTSVRFKRLKAQIGDDAYYRATTYFGQKFKENTLKAMQSAKYRKATPEERADMINKAKSDAADSMLKRFGYKEPRRK